MPEVTESPGSQPGYGIGALARRLGVAPATLRDWERRYGIGPAGRSAGGHRRYQPADIARIENMRRLVLGGMPPGEAARAALASEPATAPEPAAASGPETASEPAASGPETVSEPAAASRPATVSEPAAASRPATVSEPAAASRPATASEPAAASRPATTSGPATGPAKEAPKPPAWGAGGRSLPLPGQLPQARGLARAALALDGTAIAGMLDRALDSRGVVLTWERLAMPVLVALGERSATNGTCIDAEHLLSAELLAALGARAGRLAEPVNVRTVLLACADGEEHSLPLYALAAALAERGVRTTMLGARTPPPALADAISRIGPAAAFVWSQTAATGDPAQLSGIARQRPPLRLFTAGPGWRGTPPGGRAVSTLPEAVQQAREAVGAA